MGQYGSASRIKNRVGVTADDLGLSSSAFDSLISDLQDHASDAVEQYCQRDFEHHQGDTDKLKGNGRDTIRLPGYPVISISEVREDDSTVDADDYYVEDEATRPASNAGILVKVGGVWSRPLLRNDRNIEVDYDWGYSSPPGTVTEVVEDLVIQALHQAESSEASGAATSESMDGYSVSYGTAEERRKLITLTEDHKAQLDAFRVVAVA